MCYQRYKQQITSKRRKSNRKRLTFCQKFWRCLTFYKVINREKGQISQHECGEFYCSSCDHRRYLSAAKAKKDFIPKFIFFDFEFCQDEICECNKKFRPDALNSCLNCKINWCGKAIHRPNFVVAQTVCPKCIEEEVTPNSRCTECDTGCENCFDDEDHDSAPCKESCGFRKVTFEGEDTLEKIGPWLFS